MLGDGNRGGKLGPGTPRDGPRGGSTGLPIIRLPWPSSGLSGGRPRFLCVTSMHVDCQISATRSHHCRYTIFTSLPLCTHRRQGRSSSQRRCFFLQLTQADATCALVFLVLRGESGGGCRSDVRGGPYCARPEAMPALVVNVVG